MPNLAKMQGSVGKVCATSVVPSFHLALESLISDSSRSMRAFSRAPRMPVPELQLEITTKIIPGSVGPLRQ